MIEITYLREMEKVQSLAIEMQEAIKGILEILDTEYGADNTLSNNRLYPI